MRNSIVDIQDTLCPELNFVQQAVAQTPKTKTELAEVRHEMAGFLKELGYARA